jgi:hypothetical protein
MASDVLPEPSGLASEIALCYGGSKSGFEDDGRPMDSKLEKANLGNGI